MNYKKLFISVVGVLVLAVLALYAFSPYLYFLYVMDSPDDLGEGCWEVYRTLEINLNNTCYVIEKGRGLLNISIRRNYIISGEKTQNLKLKLPEEIELVFIENEADVDIGYEIKNFSLLSNGVEEHIFTFSEKEYPWVSTILEEENLTVRILPKVLYNNELLGCRKTEKVIIKECS